MMEAMNTLVTYIIVIFLFIKFSYSQSDISIAAESSIIPLQLSTAYQPMLHFGGIQEHNGIRLFSGLQFQPTKNLIIGGVLSPQKIESDLSIYYHMFIGYITKWKIFNISSNMFQIGMHRNRFKADGDARWFNFSFLESARFGSFNLNLCWNRLFTQHWDNDTLLISTDLKLTDNLYLTPAAMIYFTNNFDYTSFVFLSLNL